jgi:GH24 family phage-related lysozyme (muramidase)
MRLSDKGRDFLIAYEKKAPKVYRDSAGHLTIGIGHLITDHELKTGRDPILAWRSVEDSHPH